MVLQAHVYQIQGFHLEGVRNGGKLPPQMAMFPLQELLILQ